MRKGDSPLEEKVLDLPRRARYLGVQSEVVSARMLH